MHAVLRLPAAGAPEAALLARAAGHGLALGGLGDHWHTAGDHPGGLIVGYGTSEQGRYAAAVDLLVRLLGTP